MKTWNVGKARAMLFGLLFLSTFLLMRVYDGSPVFFIPSPADDTGYLAYTQSILRGQGFDWCNPAVTDGNLKAQCATSQKAEGRAHAYNMYAPGPAITLLPATAIGHWLDRFGLFSPANVDPMIFWSIVGTFFLFALGTFLLFECSLFWLKDVRRAWWITASFAIGNPLMYYVMRRPLMSHAVEYFLFFAGIYLLVRVLRSPRPIVPAILLGISAGLMMITRLNNVHIPAFLGILLLFWPGQDWARARFTKVFSYVGGIAPCLLLFLWINYVQKGTFLYSTQSYYEHYTIGFFLKLYAVNPLRVLLWFFGPHWGLVWLVPFAAYQFFVFFNFRRELWKLVQGTRLIPLGLITLVFLLHLNMMANGPTAMSYAYRYIFTYYYLLHVGFLLVIARFGFPASERTFTGFAPKLQALLLASMVVSSAHIMNFETKVKALRPQVPLVAASEEWVFHPFWRDTQTWASPYFALHSYKHMLLANPLMALAGSPLAALPVMLIADTPLGGLPGIRLAVEFYRSEMRKVYSWRDLKLTYQYVLFFAFAALLAALITRRWRTLEPG